MDAPAKPLADWHVQRADDRIVVRQGPDPGPGESDLGPPQRLTDEFSTLTLARIYESQGYLDKALDIYQTLHAKHPEHPEVLDRLRALQERMAGFEEGADAEVPDAADDPRPSFEFAPAEAANVEPVPEDADDPEALQLADADDEIAAAAMAHDPTEPAAPHEHDTAVPSPPIAEEPHADLGATPPVSDEDVPYEDGVAWRLLDVESLDAEPHRRAEELREVTEGVRAREQAKRHTVIGTPQQTPRPRQAKEQSASSEPDFERFLRYVRSIKR